MKKTLKDWENSNLDLSDYLIEPCEIDEALDLYIGECVAPQYCGYEFTQCGEAERVDDDILYYMTTSRIGDKHFYLGILPEFRQ